MGIIFNGVNYTAILEDEYSEIINVELGKRINISSGIYYVTIKSDDYFNFLSVTCESDWGDSIPLTMNEEKTMVMGTINLGSFDEVYVSVVLTESQPPTPPDVPTVTGFNKVYLVDNENMISLTKERFIYAGGDVTSPDVIDLGAYMINVLELPFDVPSELLGNETQIRLGNDLLNSRGIFVLTDEMILNLGEISVPAKYNNSYDYLDTEITLYLPFSDTIPLNSEYVIGCTISIAYHIDLYYGDMTINIRSTRTNKIIHTSTAKMGKEIPFIRNSKDVMNKLTTIQHVNNGILTPYIEVIRNRKYDDGNIFKNNIQHYGKIGNENGFISVENVVLNLPTLTNEKESISNLLRNGVFIK